MLNLLYCSVFSTSVPSPIGKAKPRWHRVIRRYSAASSETALFFTFDLLERSCRTVSHVHKHTHSQPPPPRIYCCSCCQILMSGQPVIASSRIVAGSIHLASVPLSVHTHTHTHLHNLHTHTHTDVHTHIHKFTHTCTHNSHAYTHTHTLADMTVLLGTGSGSHISCE